MELELRSFHSADVDRVWEWTPSNEDEVYFQLTFEVGERGAAGGHLFQTVVCSPAAFRTRVKSRREGWYYLVIDDYSWEEVTRQLLSEIQKRTRGSWNDSMVEIGKRFIWEYSDCG
jgi:hypothetical protein